MVGTCEKEGRRVCATYRKTNVRVKRRRCDNCGGGGFLAMLLQTAHISANTVVV